MKKLGHWAGTTEGRVLEIRRKRDVCVWGREGLGGAIEVVNKYKVVIVVCLITHIYLYFITYSSDGERGCGVNRGVIHSITPLHQNPRDLDRTTYLNLER